MLSPRILLLSRPANLLSSKLIPVYCPIKKQRPNSLGLVHNRIVKTLPLRFTTTKRMLPRQHRLNLSNVHGLIYKL
jgi:hypothetical protein